MTRPGPRSRRRLAVLASGRGTNAGAIFEAIGAGELEMEAALLVCDRPAAGALDVATRHGVPSALVPRADFPHRDAQQAAILERLVAAGTDVVALAGFSSILGPPILTAFEGRIVNIHPSLLPAFAGLVAPEPQAAALRAGVDVTGCTVHLVTADVDAGPILAQAEVPVLPGDDVETLVARILVAEHRLYPRVLRWLARDRVRLVDGRVELLPEGRSGH